jgi:transcriptional regulator with XRE-family HTH domain
MKDRIRQIRKNAGLTQVEYGRRLGVAGNTVTNYENGMREPSNAIITAICREFNVNEEWLRTGKGSMYLEMSRAELAAKIVGSALDTDDDFVLNTFVALGQLTPAEWDVIKKFVTSIKGE